ncbi:MAG: type II secretion system protein [Limisphaerales bacterium]
MMSTVGRNRTFVSARLHGGGFTLMELLVVMAVIAISAALLLPVLGRTPSGGSRVNELFRLPG